MRTQTIHGVLDEGKGAPPPRGVGGGAVSSLHRLQRVRCGPGTGAGPNKRAYSERCRGMHTVSALFWLLMHDARTLRNLPEESG